jgi:hypothetical protein
MNISNLQSWSSPTFTRLRYAAVACGILLAASLAEGTTVIPPDFPALVNESDYVVRGSVKSVTSEWRESEGNRSIHTFVTLDVSEVIKGSPPQPLVLEMLGGTVGTATMTIEGAPRFAVGQEGIFFVQGNGRNIYPLLGMMHGLYPILKEAGTGREYVARSNKRPLQGTEEVALPMTENSVATLSPGLKNTATALTPAQFTQKIKAAVNPAYTRARLN